MYVLHCCHTAEGAKVWWRYAFKSVVKQLTSHHVNWADLKRAAGLRKQYIPHYIKCLQEGKVGGDEVTAKMDAELDQGAITLFR